MSKCKYGYDIGEGTYIIRTGLYGTYTAALIVLYSLLNDLP